MTNDSFLARAKRMRRMLWECNSYYDVACGSMRKIKGGPVEQKLEVG